MFLQPPRDVWPTWPDMLRDCGSNAVVFPRFISRCPVRRRTFNLHTNSSDPRSGITEKKNLTAVTESWAAMQGSARRRDFLLQLKLLNTVRRFSTGGTWNVGHHPADVTTAASQIFGGAAPHQTACSLVPLCWAHPHGNATQEFQSACHSGCHGNRGEVGLDVAATSGLKASGIFLFSLITPPPHLFPERCVV